MKPLLIEGTTINDVWFQLLYALVADDGKFEYTYLQKIQKGSFENDQVRRQFYFIVAFIKHPWEDMIVKIPENLGIPSPVDEKYVYEEYFPNYLMDPTLKPGETYTYASRIHTRSPYFGANETQMGHVIDMLKQAPLTNQATIEIGSPEDLWVCKDSLGHLDPPCLRIISFKVHPETMQLQMSIFFRSWDLWAGMPGNLAGLELLKQYVCSETGLENGPMIISSDGLHLYGMYEEVARIRTGIEKGKEYDMFDDMSRKTVEAIDRHREDRQK